MNELKQKAWLLIIIAILAITKFIVLPVLDWQDTQLAEIKLLEKKLTKTNYILANKEQIKHVNQQLQQVLAQSEPLFSSFKNDSSFKLNQQKMLERLLTKFTLSSQNIGWKSTTRLTELDMKKFQVELKMSGKTLNIIRFMTEIETMQPRIEIENFNIAIKRQLQGDLGFSTARMTLSLYNKYINNKN